MPHAERLLHQDSLIRRNEVVDLGRQGIKKAAGLAVRAFKEDPMMEYVFPRGPDDERKAYRFSLATIRYGLMVGEGYTTQAESGFAVWLPPGHKEISAYGLIRSGMFFVPFMLGRQSYRRLLNCIDYTVRVHKELMPEPHWYLQELAVEPKQQGIGIGGALLEPVLEKADSEGHPCYLETFTGRGVRFYKRRGFKVVLEGEPPRGGPYCWSMRREASGTR